MILETLKSANSVILDSVNTTIDKQAAENFKNQVISLNAYTLQLEQLLNLTVALKEKRFATGVITADIRDSLQNAVDSCGENTNNHTLDAGTVLALKNAIELCRTAIYNAWKDIAEKKSGAVVESLTSLGEFLDDKKEADNILENLNKMKLSIPPSPGTLDEFTTQVEKGRKIIDDMDFTSNPEVKAFIDKVRTQKATVGDLSPCILDWLKENSLSDRIQLRFQTLL